MKGMIDAMRLAKLEIELLNLADNARNLLADLGQGHRALGPMVDFLLDVEALGDSLERDPDRIAHGLAESRRRMAAHGA